MGDNKNDHDEDDYKKLHAAVAKVAPVPTPAKLEEAGTATASASIPKVAAPVYVAPSRTMPELPKVYVTRQVMFEMTAEVLANPSIETAWGLYGFIYPKSVYIVGVLRPVLGEVVRKYATTEVGGAEMANAMRWLEANEKLINANLRNEKKAQGKFAFLYMGHSHHSLGYNQYSGTDQSSILGAVKDDGMEIAIGPLALIRKNGVSFGNKRWDEFTSCAQESEVAFLFYVLTKAMVETGFTTAVKVKPTVVETIDTLYVPPLAWEFSREHEFKAQLRNLKSFGCSVKVNHVDTTGKPPLEVQFVIDHRDFKQLLIINTDWNYPEAAPRFLLLPKDNLVTMEEANRLSAMKWWIKGDDFIDVIGRMKEEGIL